jgi:AraC-like DNA-binding protein
MEENYRLAADLGMGLMIICIQKMISTRHNYFRYLPVTHELKRWGLGVTATGWTHVLPGAAYPPEKHPEDHQLNWKHGRVLDALQIVLIPSGSGFLETKATGKRRIEAGMVFLLLPGVWHRYRPDPECGWTESWIEVQGPVVDALLHDGVFTATSILHRGGIDGGIEEALESIHQVTRKGSPGFQPTLSATAMKLLALCSMISKSGNRKSSPPRIEMAVHEAERYLNDHHAEPVNVEQLAASLGVAYSHFRRAFRAQTGMAPWRYVIHLRLTRARRMLASGDAKLDDIASRVGFSSGFHLSNAFKQAYGESPDTWRRSLASGIKDPSL